MKGFKQGVAFGFGFYLAQYIISVIGPFLMASIYTAMVGMGAY